VTKQIRRQHQVATFFGAYRIPLEERALVQGLGEPYEQYMKRTWRLVPYVF